MLVSEYVSIGSCCQSSVVEATGGVIA